MNFFRFQNSEFVISLQTGLNTLCTLCHQLLTGTGSLESRYISWQFDRFLHTAPETSLRKRQKNWQDAVTSCKKPGIQLTFVQAYSTPL